MRTVMPPSARRVGRTLLAMLAVFCLPACWVTAQQGRAFEADIVKLKAQYAEQSQAIAKENARAEQDREKLHSDTEQTIKRMDAKVQEVSTALERLNHVALKTGADLAVDLDKAQKDIDTLRGEIEELQAKDKAYDVFQKDAQTKMAAWDAAQQKAAQLPTTKDAFYDAAKLKLDNGDYDGARSLFTQFLQKWGDDPLAANAQYWIGESYYGQKSYRQAGIEFQKVRDQFPKSDKAPDAMLKVAYSFLQLNLKDDAKLFLEEVEREYPKSSAARLAKQKLNEISHHFKRG